MQYFNTCNQKIFGCGNVFVMLTGFAGEWKDGDHSSPEAVLSWTGFVIMHAGYPITWSSKLQTEIALSTT